MTNNPIYNLEQDILTRINNEMTDPSHKLLILSEAISKIIKTSASDYFEKQKLCRLVNNLVSESLDENYM